MINSSIMTYAIYHLISFFEKTCMFSNCKLSKKRCKNKKGV